MRKLMLCVNPLRRRAICKKKKKKKVRTARRIGVRLGTYEY